MLVVQGTHDLCQPFARGVHLARLAGAELLVLGRAGHVPQARYPVAVNHAIEEFAGRVATGEVAHHRPDGPPRVRVLPTTLEETTMKAREPDATGFVERDGVRVAWQVYGEPAAPRRPGCAAPADLEPPAGRGVEAAGAVPRPPDPGHHLRPARQRCVRPPRRRRGVHPRGS